MGPAGVFLSGIFLWGYLFSAPLGVIFHSSTIVPRKRFAFTPRETRFHFRTS